MAGGTGAGELASIEAQGLAPGGPAAPARRHIHGSTRPGGHGEPLGTLESEKALRTLLTLNRAEKTVLTLHEAFKRNRRYMKHHEQEVGGQFRPAGPRGIAAAGRAWRAGPRAAGRIAAAGAARGTGNLQRTAVLSGVCAVCFGSRFENASANNGPQEAFVML